MPIPGFRVLTKTFSQENQQRRGNTARYRNVLQSTKF